MTIKTCFAIRGLALLVAACALSSYGQTAVSSVTSSVPSAAPGTPVTFTVNGNDAGGAAAVSQIWLLVNFYLDASSVCYVTYIPGADQFWLMNDGGNSWSNPAPINA